MDRQKSGGHKKSRTSECQLCDIVYGEKPSANDNAQIYHVAYVVSFIDFAIEF